MTGRTGLYIVVLGAVLAATGCGGSGLVRVTGKLLYKGQPIPSTLVTFQPADGRRASKGVTDDRGNFTLRFSRQDAGCTRGQHTVFLRYIVSAEEEMHTIPPKAPRELQEIIARYGDPTHSPLHYEVTRGGQFFEIQLE
jgi:hypothetical protein